MLRPAISDPVLIKPNEINFLRSWNFGREPDLPSNSSSSEHLFGGIYMCLSDNNANDTKMPKSEREKRQKKLEFQLKRRNSVLMANYKEELSLPGGMKRSYSCVELGKIYCRETTQTKRVSFSVTVPPPAYPDIAKTTYDLCPPKITARPILVRRNTTYSGKDCLVHMDFDSFIAWRRGSKMSDDVEKQKKMSKKEKEANALGKTRKSSSDSIKKEETENRDWWIVRVMKLGFDSCFQRRRVTPSPPPSTNDAIVVSIVNAN
ncbi:unnamed protein product [Caenorhabditis sp. 36 PRJEB53466]|nr:unnamed protein product [Caenorhabditis sp. 36 PRJEB53466]